MKSHLKTLLQRLFPRALLHYQAYRSLIADPNSYLYATGWMQSLGQMRPNDAQGQPTPWMNFPVVRLLDERLHGDIDLFEYGSGYSTHFYAARVRHVTSAEYDPAWFARVKAQAPANVRLILDEGGSYAEAITRNGGRHDVVIVDGRDRVQCLRASLSALTPAGVIILDDSQRESVRGGIEMLRDSGFRVLHVEGLKGTGTGIERTTIFYRDGNCLGL